MVSGADRRLAPASKAHCLTSQGRHGRSRSGLRWVLAAISFIALFLAIAPIGLGAVGEGLTALDPMNALVIVLMFFINFSIVTARLLILLRSFDQRLPWSDAFRATAVGHVVGLLPFQIVGQLLGRQAMLRQSSVTPAAMTATTLVERLAVLLVSASFGLSGALYLFGVRAPVDFIAALPWFEAACGASATLVFAVRRTAGPDQRRFLMSGVRWQNLVLILAVTGLTAVGQLVVIGTFVIGLHSVAPELDLLSLVAAAEPDPVPWTLGWVTRPWAWPQARVGGVLRVG